MQEVKPPIYINKAPNYIFITDNTTTALFKRIEKIDDAQNDTIRKDVKIHPS
jgi:hypothetical protein